jgi:hypothetical protein
MNSWVVVVYDGSEKLPAKHIFAGKEAHKFKIYSDPDRVYKGGKTAPVATPIGGANPIEEDETEL